MLLKVEQICKTYYGVVGKVAKRLLGLQREHPEMNFWIRLCNNHREKLWSRKEKKSCKEEKRKVGHRALQGRSLSRTRRRINVSHYKFESIDSTALLSKNNDFSWTSSARQILKNLVVQCIAWKWSKSLFTSRLYLIHFNNARKKNLFVKTTHLSQRSVSKSYVT